MRRATALAILAPCFVTSQLLPESSLTSNCYDFPASSFDRSNCVKCTFKKSPKLILTTGQQAVDFTLHSLSGERWTLSEQLTETPVMLIWGMHTCPAFEGMGKADPFDACAFWEEASLIEKYKNYVTFAHIVGPEPHPLAPGINFDSGTIKDSFWSTIGQPTTWESRKQAASMIQSKVHPSASLLVDYLPDNPYMPGLSQPVWCTYVHAARAAILIGMDGNIRLAQEWFHSVRMSTAIDKLLLEQGGEGVMTSQ